MWQKQERRLVVLAFAVAFIMFLALVERLVS